MFKSRISRPNRIRFSIISCYRPLGPYGFGFCKKSKKKFHACVPLSWNLQFSIVISEQCTRVILEAEGHCSFIMYFSLFHVCFKLSWSSSSEEKKSHLSWWIKTRLTYEIIPWMFSSLVRIFDAPFWEHPAWLLYFLLIFILDHLFSFAW